MSVLLARCSYSWIINYAHLDVGLCRWRAHTILSSPAGESSTPIIQLLLVMKDTDYLSAPTTGCSPLAMLTHSLQLRRKYFFKLIRSMLTFLPFSTSIRNSDSSVTITHTTPLHIDDGIFPSLTHNSHPLSVNTFWEILFLLQRVILCSY